MLLVYVYMCVCFMYVKLVLVRRCVFQDHPYSLLIYFEYWTSEGFLIHGLILFSDLV